MADDEPTAVVLPIRRERGTVVVELADHVRHLLVDVAHAVQQSAEDPSSPGFGRLYGRLDESAEGDDPLLTLERQAAVDEVCRLVVESAHQHRLSDDQAEAWLRTLGMAVTMTAANAGVRTEDDLERLDRQVSELLDLLRFLQLLLARSLDPTLEDPGDVGGPEPT